MAERTKLESYIIFSFLNTLVFCFPAHWVWSESGWLRTIGMIGKLLGMVRKWLALDYWYDR